MIEYQARLGPASVPASEAVEYLFSPASIRVRRQLEDNAKSSSPAVYCRAIEISCPVEDQARLRIRTVAAGTAGTEAIQHRLLPTSVRIRDEFENDAAAVACGGALTVAAVFCGAVQIPCRVEDQAGSIRVRAVAAPV